jgi:hypothetical protein
VYGMIQQQPYWTREAEWRWLCIAAARTEFDRGKSHRTACGRSQWLIPTFRCNQKRGDCHRETNGGMTFVDYKRN